VSYFNITQHENNINIALNNMAKTVGAATRHKRATKAVKLTIGSETDNIIKDPVNRSLHYK